MASRVLSVVLLSSLSLPSVAKQHTCNGNLHGISVENNQIKLNSKCDLMYSESSYEQDCNAHGCKLVGPPKAQIAPFTEKYAPADLSFLTGKLHEYLPERQPVSPDLLDENGASLYISLVEDATVNVTFLFEGACYENSLGLISWDTDSYPAPSAWTDAWRQKVIDENDVTIFLPNVEGTSCTSASAADNLTPGTCMRMKPNAIDHPDEFLFRAGTSFALFILPNGFSSFKSNKGYSNANSKRVSDVIWSVSALNNPDVADDLRQHAVLFMPDTEKYPETLIWAFEDIFRNKGSSDQDLNDVSFIIDVSPFSAIGNYVVAMTPTAAPTKNPTANPTPAPASALCAKGLEDANHGQVCCAAKCGKCGGCGCASRPGFGAGGSADSCCPDAILESEMFCVNPDDVGCILSVVRLDNEQPDYPELGGDCEEE